MEARNGGVCVSAGHDNGTLVHRTSDESRCERVNIKRLLTFVALSLHETPSFLAAAMLSMTAHRLKFRTQSRGKYF